MHDSCVRAATPESMQNKKSCLRLVSTNGRTFGGNGVMGKGDSPLDPFVGRHGITIGDAFEGGGTKERRCGKTVRAG